MNASTSRCPNAQACSAWDQYGPDCEAGVVLQKCFVALHREMQQLQWFARVAAGPEAIERANADLRGRMGQAAERGSHAGFRIDLETRSAASRQRIEPGC